MTLWSLGRAAGLAALLALLAAALQRPVAGQTSLAVEQQKFAPGISNPWPLTHLIEKLFGIYIDPRPNGGTPWYVDPSIGSAIDVRGISPWYQQAASTPSLWGGLNVWGGVTVTPQASVNVKVLDDAWLSARPQAFNVAICNLKTAVSSATTQCATTKLNSVTTFTETTSRVSTAEEWGINFNMEVTFGDKEAGVSASKSLGFNYKKTITNEQTTTASIQRRAEETSQCSPPLAGGYCSFALRMQYVWNPTLQFTVPIYLKGYVGVAFGRALGANGAADPAWWILNPYLAPGLYFYIIPIQLVFHLGVKLNVPDFVNPKLNLDSRWADWNWAKVQEGVPITAQWTETIYDSTVSNCILSSFCDMADIVISESLRLPFNLGGGATGGTNQNVTIPRTDDSQQAFNQLSEVTSNSLITNLGEKANQLQATPTAAGSYPGHMAYRGIALNANGQEVLQPSATTPVACCQACHAASSCVAFSWKKHTDGAMRCFLFTDFVVGATTREIGAESGSRLVGIGASTAVPQVPATQPTPQAPPSGASCTMEANKRYWGGTFVNGAEADHIQQAGQPYPYTNLNAAGCQAKCSTTPGCATFVSHTASGGCWLLRTPYSGAADDASFSSGSCGLA